MMGDFQGGEWKLSGRRSTPPARIHIGTSAKIESLKYACRSGRRKRTVHALKTPVSYGGWGLVDRKRAYQATSFTQAAGDHHG
jgi:hypothetical protein